MGLVTTLLIAAVLGAAGWYLVTRRRTHDAAAVEDTEPGETKNSRFHAVSIKYDGQACTAAQNLAGQRFLATDAPRLPLPGCDAADCPCRFAHHDDRRTRKDRRSPFAPSGRAGITDEYPQEQRSGKDRRSDGGS